MGWMGLAKAAGGRCCNRRARGAGAVAAVGIVALALSLGFTAGVCWVEPVHFEQIPGDAPNFLDVDRAFSFAPQLQQGWLKLRWRIAPGYYLYGSRLQVYRLLKRQSQLLHWQSLTQAQQLQDPNFGAVDVYRQLLEIDLPLHQGHNPDEQAQVIRIKYQGCVDAGFCYPIQWRELQLMQGELRVRRISPPQI